MYRSAVHHVSSSGKENETQDEDEVSFASSNATSSSKSHPKPDNLYEDEADEEGSMTIPEPNEDHEVAGQNGKAEDGNDDIQVLSTRPEVTVRELLRLPIEDSNQSWSLVVKKCARQRSQADWTCMRAMTFVPGSRFKVSTDEEGAVRNREQDGIYLGESLRLAKSNFGRLLERLEKDKSINRWLADPNCSLILSNPYRLEPQQFIQNTKTGSPFPTFHCPQRLSDQQDKFRIRHRPLDPNRKCELSIEVSSVTFIHHPLFSGEHVLAQELKATFTEYANRLEENRSERFIQKLKAVREVLKHTKEIVSTEVAIAGDSRLPAQLEKRLSKYRKEMKRLRDARDESLRKDKEILNLALDKWKEIKMLRQFQGYVNSDVHLTIHSLETNRAEEKRARARELEDEFCDLQEEYEATYNRQLRNYKRRLRKWSQHSQSPAEKPFDTTETAEVSSGGAGEQNWSFDPKPLPPSQFSDVEVRELLKRKYSELRRHPGDPKLILELTFDQTITFTKELKDRDGAAEIKRRKGLENTKLQIRIWLNRIPVYISSLKTLQPEFRVQFEVSIRVPLLEELECVQLEIRENGLSYRLIDVIIPDLAFDQIGFQTLTFHGNPTDVKKMSHAGVGSGIKFNIMSEEHESLSTEGEVRIRTGWSTDAEGKVMCPQSIDTATSAIVQESLDDGGTSSKIVTKTRDLQLDPNDPRNSRILNGFVSHDGDGGLDDPTNTGRPGDLEFCDWSEIQNSRRLRLLFLRDQGISEFQNLVIPVSESEILPDIFDEYEKRLEAEQSFKELNRNDIPEDIGNLRLLNKFDNWDCLAPIREIRTRLVESYESSAKQITFEDMVFEEQMPDTGTFGLNLMSLFQPRRRLRPVRKERKRIQTTVMIHTSIQLIVNIVRAINLPLRKDSTGQILSAEAITGVKLIRKGGVRAGSGVLNPFVEVWFQRKVSRTTIGTGSDPTWNQELQITIISEKENSETIFNHLEEDIYFQVYDEVAIDLLEDERRRETDIYRRLQKRWLGSIKVPFVTLYRTGRIEGTFLLQSPSVLLGYENKGSDNLGEAYLSLFITLQPPISPSLIIHQESGRGTAETAEMLDHVKQWTAELEKKGRTAVKPLVLTPNADTVLACRYLLPIEPPPEIFPDGISEFEKMVTLARYVSLFPSLRDSSLGSSQYPLWFTPDVFVSTPGGGREDHSVLLASFFIYLGATTYVVQGESIPDGPTTFVLTTGIKEEGIKGALLWNPVNGCWSKVTQPLSSLHGVYAVIGQFNIWANVSLKQSPFELDWDIEKSKDWLALFPKRIHESKLPRLEIGPVVFNEADDHEGDRLGTSIERKLKEIFMKWRQSRTTWNRYTSTKLRNLLPFLEEQRAGSTSILPEDHFGELHKIMKTYDVTGFPLHQPLSTFDSLVESVFATGLHTIDTPEVQFALGSYAKSYPGRIFSLWIYIAALLPIK